MTEVVEEKKYSIWTMMSFGTKGTLVQWINGAFGIYVFAFYEIYIGLQTELATIAFVVFAIWNAFNDPLIGYTMEKTVFRWTRKKGFRRFPWYMIAIPFWLGSYFLIFLVPTHWEASAESPQKWLVFAWYIVSICLYDFMFSLMDVNSLSIYPEKFNDPKSRKITQAFVAAFGILGLVLAFTVQPMFLPKDTVNPEDFRHLAWIASAIGLLLVIPTIPGHYEDKHLRQKNLVMLARNEQAREPKESFGKSIGRVMKNRNFMGKISIFFGYQLSALLIQSGAIYILLFVIGAKEGMLSVILGSMLGGALLSIPFWLWGANKGQTKLMCLIASITMTLSFVPMFFAKTVLAWIPCMALFGVAIGGQWFIDPPLLTEVMEDITVNTGKKETSVVWGVQAFFTRFNSALQALIFGVIHVATGFVEGAKTLAELKFYNWEGWEQAVFGIQIHSIIIPFGIMVICTILFALFYRISPQKAVENRAKLKEVQML